MHPSIRDLVHPSNLLCIHQGINKTNQWMGAECGCVYDACQLEQGQNMTNRGTPPTQFGQQKQKDLVNVLNVVTTGLYGDLVKSLPVGVGGRLQRSWTLTPASLADPVASIGTNSTYFLHLELGRKPGKGISRDGQDSVALWAKRKLKKTDEESRGFAYLLSQKYKREGRPSTMMLGLAESGSMGAKIPKAAGQAVNGSLLSKAVSTLQKELRKI